MSDDLIWEIRTPGAAQGIEVARGRSGPTAVMLAHAMPSEVFVKVRDAEGSVVAHGKALEHPLRSPMTRFTLEGGNVTRENIWPTDADLGTPVILPGGEIGILTAWWHAEDHTEWRWSIELYNHV